MPQSKSVLTRQFNSHWILVLPFLATLIVLYLGPIVDLFWLSFSEPQLGVHNYQKLFESEFLARIILTTFRICVATTIASVLLGYVVAYVIVQTCTAQRKWMLTFILISFWISVLVRTFAWLMLLGNSGAVNNVLLSIGLISDPIRFMRNELGVLIGMVQYMIPYAVLPLLANMQGVDQRLINASRNLGATRTQTFVRVYLPLTKPGIVASSLLVFIISLGFYVTPAILGGGKVLMIAEYISVQILITLRWGTATMLATLMLAGVLVILYIINRSMRLTDIFAGVKK